MFGSKSGYAALAFASALLTSQAQAAPPIDTTPVAPAASPSTLPEGWNRRASFMEIFVRSYQDSNGDGVGDIKGLISRLDYLKTLGITGIWLMPVMPSQDHDHGYAVSDYRAIDPDYGTMADFEDLIREAHKRGIGVIMDYVMNHSAADNPIFLDAVSSKQSPYRDWYLLSDTDPKWQEINPRTNKGGFWNDPWKPIDLKDKSKGYFYGIFDRQMPDWNLKNPAVVKYHEDNLRFWLNKGVDGFRFDAVTMFVENGPFAYLDQPESKTVLKDVRAVIESYPNRYMVCEASETPAEYVKTAACQNAFAFGVQTLIKESARQGKVVPGLIEALSRPEADHMPLILANHDAFAGNRVIHDLSGHDLGDYRVAAALYLLASPTPFTYYGDEVGMGNNGPNNDPGIRAPMSWDADGKAFSSHKPYRKLADNRDVFNLASELDSRGSLYKYYNSLFSERVSLGWAYDAEMSVPSKEGDAVLFVKRSGPKGGYFIGFNLSDKAQTVSVPGLIMTGGKALQITIGPKAYKTLIMVSQKH